MICLRINYSPGQGNDRVVLVDNAPCSNDILADIMPTALVHVLGYHRRPVKRTTGPYDSPVITCSRIGNIKLVVGNRNSDYC